jgi:hypothetical protein
MTDDELIQAYGMISYGAFNLDTAMAREVAGTDFDFMRLLELELKKRGYSNIVGINQEVQRRRIINPTRVFQVYRDLGIYRWWPWAKYNTKPAVIFIIVWLAFAITVMVLLLMVK